MLAFDHVVFTVADLDAGSEYLWEQHGLASIPGGRHLGHGTANRIVPLGPDYVELMAVLDAGEAATSVMGSWAAACVERGDGPAALCLRTDDLDGVAARLGLEPVVMSRRRPDGLELSWRLAGLEGTFADGLPFYIEWQVAGTEHPGRARVAHRTLPAGIVWVELGGDPGQVAAWLGPHDLDIRPSGGPPGLRRVGVATDHGTLVLD